MPSLCKFDVSVIVKADSTVRLSEFDVRLNPAPTKDQVLMSQTASAIGQNGASAPEPAGVSKTPTSSTAQCYILSVPNQRFLVMVKNETEGDVCAIVFVDGEWVYSGLSYHPNHKTICFGGRLIDENLIQEMRFVDLDTTCTY
jgi:hypothetical protein